MANNNNNKDTLYTQANAISTAQAPGSVTHTMVGGLFHDIIDWLNNKPGGIVYPIPTVVDTYLHWGSNGYDWQKPEGGGSNVTISPVTISDPKTKIADYSINGVSGSLYAPSGGGTGGGMTEDQMWGYLRNQDTNENKQINYSHLNNLSWWGNKFNTGTGNTATAITGLIQADYGIRIGGADGVWLTYDSINNALKVSDDITKAASAQVAKNFYATGGVSALGYDASGGGGGGGSLTSGSWAEYLNSKQKSDSDPEASKYLHLKSDGTVEWADGGGGSFTPNDLITKLNSIVGSPSTGTEKMLRWKNVNGTWGWAYDDIPSGGSGGSVAWGDIIGKPSFATVATSGSYNDLLNKPTIPDISGKLDASTFNNTRWWGQTVNNGKVEGDIEAGTAGGSITGFHSLELNTHSSDNGHGGFIDFHTGGQQSGVPDYTARIIEDSLGTLHVQSMTQGETQQKAGLHVGQSFDGSFIQIGDIRLIYESNSGALRVAKWNGSSEVAAHLYATGGVSALGIQPEVTGLESFTISNLNSTQIKIADKSTIWNSSTEPNNLVIETDNPKIRFKVKPETEPNHIEAAQIHGNGIQSSRFYLDDTHYLAYEGENLTFGDSSSRKKVVLQDI